jgi:signal transduction histidine kinase
MVIREGNIMLIGILDDDPAICGMLRELLELTGHTVSVYNNPWDLLSNACKYAPRHTTICIVASPTTFEELPEICLSVRDEGKGIPPDQATLLFERFVRLPQDMVGTVRGTGLGLYICKEFVEAQGGRIWIESSAQSGEGSCFCFTLLAANPVPVS